MLSFTSRYRCVKDPPTDEVRSETVPERITDLLHCMIPDNNAAIGLDLWYGESLLPLTFLSWALTVWLHQRLPGARNSDVSFHWVCRPWRNIMVLSGVAWFSLNRRSWVALKSKACKTIWIGKKQLKRTLPLYFSWYCLHSNTGAEMHVGRLKRDWFTVSLMFLRNSAVVYFKPSEPPSG